VLLVVVVFSAAHAARRVIGPLIGWEVIAVAVVLVVAYHVRWIVRRRAQRRARSTRAE
jgi:uncharacterized membrane protein